LWFVYKRFDDISTWFGLKSLRIVRKLNKQDPKHTDKRWARGSQWAGMYNQKSKASWGSD